MTRGLQSGAAAPHARWRLVVGLALGVLAALTIVPGYAVAPRATATIAGTVVEAVTNVPLASVQACIVGTTQCATSAANGQYTLGGIAAGSRSVRLTHSGHT